jgi:polyhydroxybutyrate depolymerase
VFAYHGIGASGTLMSQYIEMQEHAAGEAIVVFPDAKNGTWDLGGSTDVDAFNQTLAWLGERTCINAQRVFALGFSHGAAMVNKLGCDTRAPVRAIAPAAGGSSVSDASACKRVPVLVYHRSDDNVVSVESGRRARDLWRTTNGCTTATAPSTAPALAGLSCVASGECSGESALHYCEDNAPPACPGCVHDLRFPYRGAIWQWFQAFP